MSADLAAMLVAIVTVGVSLAGLNLALWRSVRADLRAVDTDLRADIRALRGHRRGPVAHEALHAAERQARAELLAAFAEKRELLAAIAGSREGAS